MSRIELSEGSWAEITDPGRLRGKHRAEVQSYIGSATVIDAAGVVDRSQFGPIMMTAANRIIAMLVEAWHLTYEPAADIPFRNPLWLEHITVDDLNTLDDATAEQQGKLLLRRTGREPEVDDQGRPVGPTPPAVEPSPPSAVVTLPRHSQPSSDGGTEPSTTSVSSSVGV